MESGPLRIYLLSKVCLEAGRRLLGQLGLPAGAAGISSRFGCYQLQVSADTWVDIEAAAQGLDEAEGALRAGDLMRAYAAAGNRAEALRTYEQCRTLLTEEVGINPSPETHGLYLHLLRSPSSAPWGRAGAHSPGAGAHSGASRGAEYVSRCSQGPMRSEESMAPYHRETKSCTGTR
ncbi:MAG: AfsR/SARP family transcriptional regulator [Candidatus Entotheonellia bacterium]